MRISILIVLATCGTPAHADPEAEPDRLNARSEPARIDVSPHPDGMRIIAPPSLTFAMTVEVACETQAQPERLSISIADTHLLFGGPDIGATIEASVDLPQWQSAPLRVDGFCRLGDDTTAGQRLIEDAFTARLSLRCSAGDRRWVTYATLPVGLLLNCIDREQGPYAGDSPDN